MSSRELIILILGLAIVAVVLRGLFVALRARKGQIRLAIDKNIPTDIDLDALEMAELPSGGARVVERSLESVNSQNSRLDAALKRAEDLQLGAAGEDGDVPILMDAVSLSRASQVAKSTNSDAEISITAPSQDESERHEAEEVYLSESLVEQLDDEIEFAEDEPEQSPQLGEMAEIYDDSDDAEDDEIWGNQASREVENSDEENADDVLLDYEDYSDDDGEIRDSMSSVAPDYRSTSEAEAEEEFIEDDFLDYEDDEEVVGLNDEEDDFDGRNNEILDELEDEPETIEATGQTKSFEEQLDEFSLSAGERIGFNESPAPASAKPAAQPASQPSLFDEDFDFDEPAEVEKPKSMSFFSALKRSITPQEKPKTPAPDQIELKPAEPEAVAVVSTKSVPASEISTQTITERSYQEPKKEAEASSRAQRDYETEAASQPSEVLVINVMAREGYAFAGDDLLQVLITSGLKFGEMNIFHHRTGADNKGPVLFSVANVLNPGTFDLNNMDNFTTLGVSFFLALPTVMNNLEAFEKMLTVAQLVKSGLGGELKDDNRNVMTSQTIEHYRQRVRDFELRRLKAAGARH